MVIIKLNSPETSLDGAGAASMKSATPASSSSTTHDAHADRAVGLPHDYRRQSEGSSSPHREQHDHALAGRASISGPAMNVEPPMTFMSPTTMDPEAGPSTLPPQPPYAPHVSHVSRPIPPPPSPRRHRSGVLLSRMRANTGGAHTNASVLGMTSSKSWGDLARMGAAAAAAARDEGGVDDDDNVAELPGPAVTSAASGSGSGGGKRVFSEGSKGMSDEPEESVWDNSARFYHHIHSQANSRSPSRASSPTRSNLSISPVQPTSTASSPIFVRRNLTLPSAAGGPPPGAALSASLSPNHYFLQQHLPPTFPAREPGNSPDAALSEVPPFAHSMVILTPTTQEWRELRNMQKLEDGEGLGDGGEHDDETDSVSDGELNSLPLPEPLSSSLLLQPARSTTGGAASPGRDGSPARPAMPAKSVSIDYLAEELTHGPDPGASPTETRDSYPLHVRFDDTPQRPTFVSTVIEPSPVMANPATAESPLQPAASLPAAESASLLPVSVPPAIDEDEPIRFTMTDESGEPVRFNSIGRSQSLRLLSKTQSDTAVPRVKTKRERERERLFKAMDEEIAEGVDDGKAGSWGIQEIGAGGGLVDSAPPTPTYGIEPVTPTDDALMSFSIRASGDKRATPPPLPPARAVTAPVRSVFDQTLPVKPSPLHASLVSETGLPTPTTSEGTTPADETPKTELHSPPDLAAARAAQPPPAQPAPSSPDSETQRYEAIRNYARAMSSRHTIYDRRSASPVESASALEGVLSPPRSPRRRDTSRISLVAGRVVQPFMAPPGTALPAPPVASSVSPSPRVLSLQSFSPFRSPALEPTRSGSAVAAKGMGSTASARVDTPPGITRYDSDISVNALTGLPSGLTTPSSETAGGVGGRGIDDYVILSEAGKGAYGLVMRAKVKGAQGQPVGDEVIIKYIIKARILADCWKRHKVLGPIPVEIHVMDQLRHLPYHPPAEPHPWDPSRPRSDSIEPSPTLPQLQDRAATPSTPATPGSFRSDSSLGYSAAQRYLASELKHAPERGHPNICKLLDFFEDREFYYLVMPRYGTGVDLFDRVESQPAGLDPFEVRSLLGQLADAVAFLHANNIVHRDIKDENVILDGAGRCQLIDFGSAAHWRPGKRWDTFSGTLHYASPEILRGEMYGGKEQDVWALGVVAFVLLVGETPFADLPDEVFEALRPGSRAADALDARCGVPAGAGLEQVQRHGHGSPGGRPDEGLERDGGGRLADAADLVRACLEADEADRPTAAALLDHYYLRGTGGWTGRRGWERMDVQA